MAQVVTDLTGFRTTSFAGGGLIGVGLYMPNPFSSQISARTLLVLS